MTLALVSACSSFAFGKLVGPPGWNAEGMDKQHAGAVGASWVLGSFDPCTTGGPLTVTGFAFTTSSNLVITGWAHRLNNTGGGIGMQPGIIASTDFHTGQATITSTCADAKANRPDPNGAYGNLFVIEVHRTTAATGWADGLTVSYRSTVSNAVHKSYWPVGFYLCGNTPIDDPRLAGDCS